ncbi:hypothetical protein GQ53DRAFT_746137 [Thozetella sp. PMI_491]|nr:hypothetical protein GQ53DRAFT_746137 [Thozetella sp. PMI_491]
MNANGMNPAQVQAIQQSPQQQQSQAQIGQQMQLNPRLQSQIRQQGQLLYAKMAHTLAERFQGVQNIPPELNEQAKKQAMVQAKNAVLRAFQTSRMNAAAQQQAMLQHQAMQGMMPHGM